MPNQILKTAAVVSGMLGLGAFLLFFFVHVLQSVAAVPTTRDNAARLFETFTADLSHSTYVDPASAARAATDAYQQAAHTFLIDGWSRPMQVTAAGTAKACQLTLRSAGPDGVFDNADDLTISRTFDLSVPTTGPSK